MIRKIIEECMRSLRCFSAVCYTAPGSSTEGETGADWPRKDLLASELLIPLQQLRDAAKGESILAWRGGRALMTVPEIKDKFGPWLQVYDLRDSYDVFISYRWGAYDSPFTEGLFDMFTNFSVGDQHRAVEVFLDRRRLQDGRRFKADFAAAIVHSQVAVPVVSAAALQRMLDHQADQVDNVLLEWILILECSAAQRVAKVFPVLFGSRSVDVGGSIVGDFFAEALHDKLPRIAPTATLAQAEKLLVENGITPSAEYRSTTVHSVVQEMLQFMLCKASDFPGSELVESVAEKVTSLLTDTAATAAAATAAQTMAIPKSETTEEGATTTASHSTQATTAPRSSNPEDTSADQSSPSPVRQLRDLSSGEVGELLGRVQLEPLRELFTARKVSGLMLSYCEEAADLLAPEYGLTSKGLARGLFEMIAVWKEHGVTEL